MGWVGASPIRPRCWSSCAAASAHADRGSDGSRDRSVDRRGSLCRTSPSPVSRGRPRLVGDGGCRRRRVDTDRRDLAHGVASRGGRGAAPDQARAVVPMRIASRSATEVDDRSTARSGVTERSSVARWTTGLADRCTPTSVDCVAAGVGPVHGIAPAESRALHRRVADVLDGPGRRVDRDRGLAGGEVGDSGSRLAGVVSSPPGSSPDAGDDPARVRRTAQSTGPLSAVGIGSQLQPSMVNEPAMFIGRGEHMSAPVRARP